MLIAISIVHISSPLNRYLKHMTDCPWWFINFYIIQLVLGDEMQKIPLYHFDSFGDFWISNWWRFPRQYFQDGWIIFIRRCQGLFKSKTVQHLHWRHTPIHCYTLSIRCLNFELLSRRAISELYLEKLFMLNFQVFCYSQLNKVENFNSWEILSKEILNWQYVDGYLT